MHKYILTVAVVLLLSMLVDAGVTRFPFNKRDFCCDSDSFLSFMPGFNKSWCCDRNDKKMHGGASKPSDNHHQHHTPTPTANQQYPTYQQQHPTHQQQHPNHQQQATPHYATSLNSTPATIIVNIDNNPTPSSTTSSATSTKTPEGNTREHCRKLDEKGCGGDERCYWEDSPSEGGKYRLHM
ncbi:hypothetical protein K492DRAFT_187220 [Lichtheimia hyalospora FSU 10163]|nr:hypothetical protein K492DRAFT_187220 [Lichtheimia hyalospora FSU 10163]